MPEVSYRDLAIFRQGMADLGNLGASLRRRALERRQLELQERQESRAEQRAAREAELFPLRKSVLKAQQKGLGLTTQIRGEQLKRIQFEYEPVDLDSTLGKGDLPRKATYNTILTRFPGLVETVNGTHVIRRKDLKEVHKFLTSSEGLKTLAEQKHELLTAQIADIDKQIEQAQKKRDPKSVQQLPVLIRQKHELERLKQVNLAMMLGLKEGTVKILNGSTKEGRTIGLPRNVTALIRYDPTGSIVTDVKVLGAGPKTQGEIIKTDQGFAWVDKRTGRSRFLQIGGQTLQPALKPEDRYKGARWAQLPNGEVRFLTPAEIRRYGATRPQKKLTVHDIWKMAQRIANQPFSTQDAHVLFEQMYEDARKREILSEESRSAPSGRPQYKIGDRVKTPDGRKYELQMKDGKYQWVLIKR